MSVTAARGWLAAGVAAGTKPSGDLDLALVLSEHPAAVAGAFTTNRAECAHIQVCRPRVVRGRARGVCVSAGIANAATGRAGVSDAARMADAAASACSVAPEEMLVCSTGTIGGRIPVDRVLPGIRAVAQRLSRDGANDAARAIMTTDTRPKVAVRRIDVGGRTVTVGGMAKGAGMIAPEMAVAHATMLAFLTTDAVASADELRTALHEGLPTTFNAVTVDGSTSTNDTVLVFANGASGVEAGAALAPAVREVMADLAYAIVADGEGSTKVIRIRVGGAETAEQARIGARAIADSLLFRAAVWGGDPNWGRVVQSLGQAHAVAFDPARVAVVIAGVEVATDGVGTDREAEAAKRLVAAQEVLVEAHLGLGAGSFEILTCDLTPEYVRFNADYTT